MHFSFKEKWLFNYKTTSSVLSELAVAGSYHGIFLRPNASSIYSELMKILQVFRRLSRSKRALKTSSGNIPLRTEWYFLWPDEGQWNDLCQLKWFGSLLGVRMASLKLESLPRGCLGFVSKLGWLLFLLYHIKQLFSFERTIAIFLWWSWEASELRIFCLLSSTLHLFSMWVLSF